MYDIMGEARKLGLAISEQMYDGLIREKERRKLYTLPETVRMLLSEKLAEDDSAYNAADTHTQNN